MKRRRILGILVVFLLTTGIFVYGQSQISIFIDGNQMKPTTPVSMENGKVIASVRDVAEALGATVSWDAERQSVMIQSKAQDSRVDRLEQALAPGDPLSAATDWAEGVKQRNGALQYALLSPELKEKSFDDFASMNWSTGTSSPWVASYTVKEMATKPDGSHSYEVAFVFTDSTGSQFTSTQSITVAQFDDGWFLTSIEGKS